MRMVFASARTLQGKNRCLARYAGIAGLALAWCGLVLPVPVVHSMPPTGGLDVTAYGAVGDGVTDSTAAFQAGLEAAGEQGRPLFVPAGRYLLSDHLEMPASVELAGAGAELSVLTSEGVPARLRVHASGTTIRDLGFEDMVEPIALVTRAEYVLENLRIERCRFERIEVPTRNRGAIGLSSGRSRQRQHPIRHLLVRDCLFKDINARAIAIRANISEVWILNNQFLEIVNPRTEGMDGPLGGAAVQLGESSDDAGMLEEFAMQGRHRIEGNVVRGMRKSTSGGNLIGFLIYGNYNSIRDNLLEDIDGTETGQDTNAMYIRGAYNKVIGNTIRNVHGADDDGALCFKGGLDQGSRHNLIAYNTIQDIRGMSAIEASSSKLQVTGNVIIDAPVRGFFHRTGESLWLQNNTFIRADAVLRTARRHDLSDVQVSGNRFLDSGLVLSQYRRDVHRARRTGVYIHDNLFRFTEASGARRMIRLGNGVVEPYVSIRGNRFHNLQTAADGAVAAGRLVDLVSSAQVLEADIIGNHVIQRGPQTAIFHVGRAAGNGRFADNRIEVLDLRGPVLEGAYSVVENNTVIIPEGAAGDLALDAIYVLAAPAEGHPRVFRNNRLVRSAPHARLGAVVHWRGAPEDGQVVVEGNSITGAVKVFGRFDGAEVPGIEQRGNRLPDGAAPVFEAVPGSSAAIFPGAGRGTPAAPYRVASLEELQALRYAPPGAAYTLAGDLEASVVSSWDGGRGFLPVGCPERPFTGRFDGAGHVIRGLTVKRPDDTGVGLFGYVGDGAVIHDIGLEDVTVEGFHAVGGLIGLQAGGEVKRVFTTGRVRGIHDVGGLIGMQVSGSVADAYSHCAVAADSDVSGLIGFAGGQVLRCYAAGPVQGLARTLGLIGYAGTWLSGYRVVASYWDADRSPQQGRASAPGKTTSELQDPATFMEGEGETAWDMAPHDRATGTTWKIATGHYPRLAWEK